MLARAVNLVVLGSVGCAVLRCPDPPVVSSERNRALVVLGQALFFEQRLSATNGTSCSSCHLPERAFADRRRFSRGQYNEPTTRNAPSLINRPRVGFEFWDGRALSLADQVAHPLENAAEMGDSMEAICARIVEIPRYPRMFAEAFGSSKINGERLALAIATYLQTLRAYEADYERAKEAGTLSAGVLRGEAVFRGKASCVLCHTGPNFTDERFHNTGVAWKSRSQDEGRASLTGREEDLRAFKTPTLRELVRTAPYMHDGSISTLEEVIEHYVEGGVPNDPKLDPALQPINLTAAERRDLVAFLRSLSDSRRPPFVRPESY